MCRFCDLKEGEKVQLTNGDNNHIYMCNDGANIVIYGSDTFTYYGEIYPAPFRVAYCPACGKQLDKE